MPLIELLNVSHTYPDQLDKEKLETVRNISLTIADGTFTALVGPSGIGKSTLLRIVAGLLPPTNGNILINGRPLQENKEPFGILFQQNNLFPWRTALENVRLPLELAHIPLTAQLQAANAMLDLVGLTQFADYFPAQLSGGMAQRVALARALIHNPSLLLLDEPFGALDALTRERLGQELLQIRHLRPVTVFMVTHSIAEAVLLADTVLVMNGSPGQITHTLPITLPRPRQQEMDETPLFHQHVHQVRRAIENLG